MGAIRSIRAQASSDEVTLWIMSEVTSWTAQDFAYMADFYGASKKYILNIYSPGGDPFAAFAIHDFIKAHGMKVTARIWGHAASAAAIIACSCERVEIGEMSYLMIHNAYGGDSQELLDSLNAKQTELFAAHTGKSKGAITKLMDAETWMDAKTAKAEGFADSIIKELAIAATYKASYMEQVIDPATPPVEPIAAQPVEPQTPPVEPEPTEEVEQLIEVSTADAIQAAITGKLKAKVSVGKELRSQLSAAIAEVKEVKAKADEAISEAEGLKEKQAKAEQDLKAANEEAAKAKAEVEALQAKVTEITSEVEKLKKAPLANAEGEPKGGAGVQTPGAGAGNARTLSPAEQKAQKREEEMREAYERFNTKNKQA